MRANYKMQRLFVDAVMAQDVNLTLEGAQAHYLLHVLRKKEGSELLVFNGRDGEWRAVITKNGRKSVDLVLTGCERVQTRPCDLIYCFAPLKHARLDYMVQKAVEMGAGSLQPVMTQYTQATKLNSERMQANIIEAAEQCGILSLPDCKAPVTLQQLLDHWDRARILVFCDEAADTDNPQMLLQQAFGTPVGILIGPEGGFSDEERQMLCHHDFVLPIPLGPRILRADTAAVAAMAVVQMMLGDWH